MKKITNIFALAAIICVTLFAKPLDGTDVSLLNNYTRTVTCTLNFASASTLEQSVSQGTNITAPIGFETLTSVTIWNQTVSIGQNALITDPMGGLMRVTTTAGIVPTIGWGVDYVHAAAQCSTK
jgi:hypothetical protein